jgi:hypothetical protein
MQLELAAADVEDLAALQFEVAAIGFGQHLNRGRPGRRRSPEQGDGWGWSSISMIHE